MAERPNDLSDIFYNSMVSENGIYAVTMYALGLPVTITFDDYLPWLEKSGKAPFLRPGPDKALWGPLIEKAFAKLHGSYESIVGGNPAEATRFLTGAPAFMVAHS